MYTSAIQLLTLNFSLFTNSDMTRGCLLSAPSDAQALTSRHSVSSDAQTVHKIKEKMKKHKSNFICFVDLRRNRPPVTEHNHQL